MKSKLLLTFFAFLAVVVVKAGGIEIDSIRHPLIIDGMTAAPMVNQSNGFVPSKLSKAASPEITPKDAEGENFNLITTGTFTSTLFNSSYTAKLSQSDKNPNRFLITPFINNSEGIIVEITHNTNEAGAHILKVTTASTGYEYQSYGMVSAIDAYSYDSESEHSNFDGTTFRLNLRYVIINVGSFGVFSETFEIPEGLVAYTEEPNDGILYYSLTESSSHKASVVGLKDTDRTTVDIPESVSINGETYSVTSIGDEAFESCSCLTSVTIPNTITSIGNASFSNCTGLTSIDIPNSVISIGNASFSNCTGLTSIDIPNSVISIGESAFQKCTGLTSVTIPNSVTRIGEFAFGWCENLSGDLVLPNSLTYIGDAAFFFCNGITSIFIPASVTTIEDAGQTFASTNLESIKVDADNKVYDSREDCNAIIETASNTLVRGCKNTVIPNTVTTIGFRAFVNSINLKEIVIPPSVTTIDGGAFVSCVSLTKIDIPNSVTSIGSYAFDNCKGLTEVSIPNSVASIEKNAFYGCISLKEVYALRTDAAAYNCADDAFSKVPTDEATLHVPTDCRDSYANLAPWSAFGTITDDNETAITPDYGESFKLVTTGTFTSTFFSYSYTAELRQSDKNPNRFLITPFIKSEEGIIVEITHKKDEAGAYMLKVDTASTGYEHSSYGMISAGEAGEEGSESNFDGTTFSLNLKYYVSAGYFGDYAETFEIPQGLVSYTEGPDDGVLLYSITDASRREVSVLGLKDTERTAVDIPESVEKEGVTYTVTSIGDEAFANCSNLTSINIPSSVTSIGDDAFFFCTGLTSINIPNSVTSIGYRAFGCCTSLTSIDIPNSVTSIGEAAFISCFGLTSIDIPNSVTSIENGAFFNCTGLTSINIPNSVTEIGDEAFAYCSSLTSINIPNSVTSIGEAAFYNCTGLTSITIPSSVTSIGDYAFRYCSSLASIVVDANNTVYDSRENCNAIIETLSHTLIVGCKNSTIPNSVTSIGDAAFRECTGLTSITIPNSVTSIGARAFMSCESLTEVRISESVNRIENRAFYGCISLKEVYVLRTDATAYNCADDAFSKVPTDEATLHVPTGCRESYANLAPWSAFGTITDDNETAITPVGLSHNDAKYYNIKGQQFINAQPGVNIIRFSDGTTKKVLVK